MEAHHPARSAPRELVVERSLRGSDLVGRRYAPPFDWFAGRHADLWRVVAADFVELDAGTIELVKQLKGEIVALAFLIELTALKGRDKLTGYDLVTLIQA